MTQQAPTEAAPWPAIEYEERPWEIDDRGPISRTQRRRVTGPYQAAVPAQIADISSVPIPQGTLALADEATAEVARFDGSVGTLLAPFSAVLLRSESAASSKIERLTASAKAIALAELGSPRSANAISIVANTTALTSAIDLADHLDADAIEATQRALLAGTSPELVGWRREQVWIGGSDFGPHHADFVPPHHERMRATIDDLVAFLQRDDLSALTHAAVAHAQFETIHPFADGNGRTGRALIHSLLRARGTTTNITVPVSAGLLTDTGAYFQALDAYRAGDPEPIVRRLAQASLAAVHNGGILVDQLRTIEAGWNERLTARRDAAAWRILGLLIAQPAIDWPTVERQLQISSPAAYRAIDQLVAAEILTEVTNNKWGRVWTAPEVLAALDAFAARAGRRTRA